MVLFLITHLDQISRCQLKVLAIDRNNDTSVSFYG